MAVERSGEKSLYKKVVIQHSGAIQQGNTYPSCVHSPWVPRLIDLNVNGCLSFTHSDGDIDASEVYPGESIINHFEGIRVGLLRSPLFVPEDIGVDVFHCNA